MDRLPWSRWHWLVILSLGFVWVLDGLKGHDQGRGRRLAAREHRLLHAAFQRGAGLEPDGTIGPRTRAALRAADERLSTPNTHA